MLRCPPLMRNPLHFLLFFLGVVRISQVLDVHGQSQEGFISIDCGIADGSGYEDTNTNLNFTPDSAYIDTGENKDVPSDSVGNLARQYRNLRSFPNGSRNCYKLWPVRPGGKYLIRAGFWYGNYDGENSVPEFDLHVGVNFWTSVSLTSPNGGGTEEIITVAQGESIWFCLVNTGLGTPFVSTLELRPLLHSMYPLANLSQSLVRQDRWNYGASSQLRYPNDPYDRIWFPVVQGFKTLNSTREVRTKEGDPFLTPPSVMRTAATTGNLTDHVNMEVAGNPDDRVYVVLHFAELEQLMSNDTRRMDIYYEQADQGSPRLLYGNYSPPFLEADARDATVTNVRRGKFNITVYASASSTRPYLINAFESFDLRPMEGLPTDQRDVDTIEDIKRSVYKAKGNWNGDPCAPKEFAWEGVTCSYDASQPPRIVLLNLSSSSLNDGIPASIANLTALTTLDLSNNNLTGTIPDFLAELPSLRALILTGNQLIGTPRHLCEKVQNAVLSLSIEGDRNPCLQVKEKKKIIIPVTIVASSIFLVLLVVFILFWRNKRRGRFNGSNGQQREEDRGRNIMKGNEGLKRESHCFTFPEIRNITRNFETAIGKGGFGVVYLGYLNTRTHVAVKVLSQSSSQGTKEFQAEAILLTRVHHKNLVSLLGYCDDENNLALVYEFMEQGNLKDHLSGKIDNINVLSWEQRVKIALQAAQGLDYLHNGCKPTIVHRDVKSANILLDHDFVAKLADFGLSRAFNNENHSHISTAVVGTPGYLDPEYYQTYRLNEKSDVYSFGVVLLEIITGQPPFPNWSEKTHIVQWVNSRLECGDISNIVDTRLQGDYDTNSIWIVLEVAMACTSMASTQRLNMSNVVTQLKNCLVGEATNNAFTEFDMLNRNSIEDFPLKISSRIAPSAR